MSIQTRPLTGIRLENDFFMNTRTIVKQSRIIWRKGITTLFFHGQLEVYKQLMLGTLIFQLETVEVNKFDCYLLIQSSYCVFFNLKLLDKMGEILGDWTRCYAIR